MKKIIPIFGILLSFNALSFSEEPLGEHDLKIYSETRDKFKRDFIELNSNFGLVGPGIVMSELAYHLRSNEESLTGKTESQTNLNLTGYYLYPIKSIEGLALGGVSRFVIADSKLTSIKSGLVGAYQHDSGFYAKGQYRFDREIQNANNRGGTGLTNKGYKEFNYDRKDIILGYNQRLVGSEIRFTHAHFVHSETKDALRELGHDGQFAEAELTFTYRGLNNITPYISAIWESRNKYANPEGGGSNGYSVGMSIHF